MLSGFDTDTFDMDHFEFRSMAECSYLQAGIMKQIYIYHNCSGGVRANRVTRSITVAGLRAYYVILTSMN